MMDKERKRILFEQTFVSLLEQGKEIEIPVYGLSMFPVLMPGDRVKVVKGDKLRIGDVIVFKNNGNLIAHRLLAVDIENKVVLSKGDALKKSDKVYSLQSILGVAIVHKRNNKEIKWTMSAKVKRVLAFVSPLMGYINFYLGVIWSKFFKTY
ncbi:S24/S26 family peptidase [Labilibacter marinus]|uniref:S24/S26 family peptidase n=1 Tax=Labilibacter marinus TaxID=1477105 RepID=UPI00094FD720|nr:S24/S26 family peptidase [Labilibacter marinus]